MKSIFFNSCKKATVGVAILGLAFATQSFTEKVKIEKKLAGVHRFYNTTGSASMNRTDYVYQDESDLLCNDNNTQICSAEWNLGAANPSIGQAPPANATFVNNSENPGQYQP